MASKSVPAPLATMKAGSLELKVEPSFSYRNPIRCIDGNLRAIRKPQELKEGGLDVSLYKNEELCLPSNYCSDISDKKSEVIWAPSVNKTPRKKQVRQIFVPLIQKLTEVMPPELTRVYEIRNTNRNPTNFNLGKYEDSLEVSYGVDNESPTLLVFSKDKSDAELIESFWSRNVPNRNMPDNPPANNFSIHFVDPEKLRGSLKQSEFKKEFLKSTLDSGDNLALIRQAEATIMNDAYGYKARIHSDLFDVTDNLTELIRKSIPTSFPKTKTIKKAKTSEPKIFSLNLLPKHQECFYKIVPSEQEHSLNPRLQERLETAQRTDSRGIRESRLNGFLIEDISTPLTQEAIEENVMEDYKSIWRDAHRRNNSIGIRLSESFEHRGKNLVAKIQAYHQDSRQDEDNQTPQSQTPQTLVGYTLKYDRKGNKALKEVRKELVDNGYQQFEPNFEPLKGTSGHLWVMQRLFARNHNLTDLRPWAYKDLKEMLVG